MSYQSLARKYRPRHFQDMVGQDAITKALANAIRLKRIPQGVIFSGVRGIGKTTTARLYAKALNCEQGPTAEPCNQCESCLAINDGNHEDVLEIDGASNTSVDDVRALQETLEYVPQRSPYKIYIIDEVHMLSQSAFNALLKTLEEPPQHVVFTFATTELQKVPETILSRCQTFHLKRLSLATITDRLKEILNQEKVAFEDHAIVTVAKEGRGSMRDALTFLDQVIALGDGQVTAASLKGLVNAASSQSYIDYIQALVERNGHGIIKIIDQWDERGIPLDDAVEEVAKFCRHGFVLKDLGLDALDTQLLGLAPTELEHLYRVADQSPSFDLNRIFRFLVKCRKDLDGSELDRFILENYSLEWCFDPGLPSLDDLKQLAEGKGSSPAKPESQQGSRPRQSAEDTSGTGNRSGASSGASLKQRWASAFAQDESKQTRPAAPIDTAPAPSPSPAKEPIVPQRNSEVQSGAARANSQFEPSSKLVMQKEAEAAPASGPPSSDAPPPRKKAISSVLQKIAASAEPKLTTDQPSAPQAAAPEPVPDQRGAASFPESWRALVDIWKSKMPLQGRILEETVPLAYSVDTIRVAVDPSSMAGAKLLHQEHRKRVVDGIRELFGFSGELLVESQESSVNQESSDEAPAPESLLQVRQKEEEAARQELFEELRQHPITQEALSVFGGKIDGIDMLDV
ncbi:DNA polymerase III subunit gamma/tau [Pseudobacteriovorax antillogorgiicola]|uniref:DNA polymerase III subunit gamma/tau n=1 Tax=Pseudobacteriovorax antillogorgiicola TaxID=1513793 RepID=A0A1Y6B7A2_9BACT|nr:DNA polymerase III subunit gamma/tau [Pseudobacteriovorax antillogorgiicola]TCS59463.1 DNA polymerase III subunit gamma/tau [Pseudobacteriovorax antillogorgiicola]SME88111.1 DNA polymerase III, subunit gamma and tau [Pseudobacteriovorax antillogorgiicola]